MGKDVVVQRKSPGEGETAEYGTVVKCHLTGYFYSTVTKERTSDEPFEVLKDQSFQIGEADTVPGLELALRHARKGEKLSVFIASRFAFGIAGRNYQAANQGNTEKKNGEGENEQNNEKLDLKSPAIKESNVVVVPPDQDIEYEIEVLTHRTDREFDSEFLQRFESACNGTLTEEEKDDLRNRLLTLQSLQLRKESGNRWFSYGEYGRAAKAYSKATQISEGYFNKPTGEGEAGDADNTKSLEEKVLESEAKKEEKIPAEENEVVVVYVSCLNNLAACKLATKEYYQAKELCTKVLEFSPFNAKALLRAAKASLATDSFEECELCLKRLLDLEKLDKNIKAAANAELAKLRKAQANYKAQAKEMQKRIAGKLFGNTTSKPSATNTPTPSKQENKDVTESKEIKETQQKEESHSSIDSYNEGTTTTKATSKTSSNLVLLLATSFIVVALSIFLALTYKAKK